MTTRVSDLAYQLVLESFLYIFFYLNNYFDTYLPYPVAPLRWFAMWHLRSQGSLFYCCLCAAP